MTNENNDSDKFISQLHSKLCAIYRTRTAATTFLAKHGRYADYTLIIDDLHRTLISSFKQRSNTFKSNSNENFRFELQDRISSGNTSPEKILEKLVATMDPDRWANQVPVASGIFSSKCDKKRSIDLVQRLDEYCYEFIELKTQLGTNNPVYAAFEILLYGIIYVFYRNCKPLQNTEKPILAAKTVRLIVAAPIRYYKGYEHLEEFQAHLSDALSQWVPSAVKGLHMDFHFETFDYEEASPADKSNVARFINKRPLF